jgi:ubiquinol-cytochrome c reductase iron-sulfur subunit
MIFYLLDHSSREDFINVIIILTFVPFSTINLMTGYASDAAVSTSGSNGNGSMVPVNSGAILNALKTPNSEPNYAQENHRVDKIGDPDKRAFTYFVLTGGRMIYASAIRLAVLKFLMSMSATADVLALASLEVDLSKIQPGTTTTVKWRGKPVFIRRRTADEIAKENAVDMGELRDKQADADRTQNPEWLVVVGVCTHLGCVPIANAGDYNGWFCPCHGSHYDASGRIRKGPAPENLEVPEYSFQDETTMIVG